jgi:putative ABC transport system ATP-binding protein
VLELHDVVKHYRLGKGEPIRAADGVSMTVADGEFVALYGPSGSGKTTLLEIIAAGEPPDRGTVLVNGQDIFSLSGGKLDQYRLTQLGIVGPPEKLIPGAPLIKNATLRLILSDARKANATILPLLERLGLTDRIRHKTEQLSMGERQRLMIVIALSTNPTLVLADEPTGNLDTELTREVLALLREICAERGATVILATHDEIAASFADQVYELRDGRLSVRRTGQSSDPDHLIARSAL